jgi:predicted Fe-Mo cluster-binding NifX family protein
LTVAEKPEKEGHLMKIGLSSTGRSMCENVYKRFWQAPAYIVFNTRTKTFECVTNYAKYGNGCGPQAAQMLINKGISAVLAEDSGYGKYVRERPRRAMGLEHGMGRAFLSD